MGRGKLRLWTTTSYEDRMMMMTLVSEVVTKEDEGWS